MCGIGPEFRKHGFFGRMFFILLFAGLQRQKYYFAWKLGIHCLCFNDIKFVEITILINYCWIYICVKLVEKIM